MACGAVVVIGSTKAPVVEVIEDSVSGLLVDYFDDEALAAMIAQVPADPAHHSPLAEAARATVVKRFDLKRVCLPAQVALGDQVEDGEIPF